MVKYKQHDRRRGFMPRHVITVGIALLLVIAVGIGITRHIYNRGLKPINSSQQTQIFTVETGSSTKLIAKDLEDKKLIRSAWAMQLYVHSKELGDKLQAGTYAFSPSQGTKSIVTVMTKGKVATRLVTILPGRRIDQIRADLINDGFTPSEVDTALDPAQYKDMPVLSFKPESAQTLEGLLWPDSYERDQTTSPTVIIRQSLQAMGDHLTQDVQAGFAQQGLTVYRGLTLASIVLQEVNKPADQAQAAQVFYKRLRGGMMLGSDVTARYGAIIANREPDLSYDSPYNTLKHTDLPPTPISNVDTNSLDAVTHPAATDWLYFVAGDDGTTHFSTNLQDHEAATDKYCHKLCGR